MRAFGALVSLAAMAAASLRWLRVAQREHYLAATVSRTWWRWVRPWPWSAQAALAAGAVAGAAATGGRGAWLAPAGAAIGVLTPLGLGLRGRTSKLAWTRRLRTVAAVVWALDVSLAAAALALPAVGVAGAVAQFAVVDAALALLAPIERRAAGAFVHAATERLRAVGPDVVAITGSFGKTSTKQYVRHLLAGTRSVLASPASFNNTAGLSRTVNEHLSPGTEVLVAEMGMYGPGEVRAMCEWVQPRVGVICNIGPVHLERVGSLDGIVAAKRELLEHTEVAVVNVDAHGLAAVADDCERAGQRVVRCSATDTAADVCVRAAGGTLDAWVGGTQVAYDVPSGAQASNLACAIGVAVALGVPVERLVERVVDLPVPEHRQQVGRAPSGVTVIDNTFSSNPASAASSLALLARLGRPGHRRVVVTPGMVELGPAQGAENERFGAAAAAAATDLVIVGRTNARALARGAAAGPARVHRRRTRPDAVAWVRATCGDGDVVLYENDLPDHYA